MTVRTIVLLALFALCPRVAHAQWGWWEFLETLSGPELRGRSIGYRLLCTTQDPAGAYAVDWTCWSDRDPRIRQLIDVHAGRWTSGGRPLFADTPGDTREVVGWSFGSGLMVRLSPVLDAGMGARAVRFSGDGFGTFWRAMLTPAAVSFTPLAIGPPPATRAEAWRRVLKIRYDQHYFPRGFTGADFGNPATAFSTRSEWVGALGLVLDFGVFLQ